MSATIVELLYPIVIGIGVCLCFAQVYLAWRRYKRNYDKPLKPLQNDKASGKLKTDN